MSIRLFSGSNPFFFSPTGSAGALWVYTNIGDSCSIIRFANHGTVVDLKGQSQEIFRVIFIL
jgi:hypothetical protein